MGKNKAMIYSKAEQTQNLKMLRNVITKMIKLLTNKDNRLLLLIGKVTATGLWIVTNKYQ